MAATWWANELNPQGLSQGDVLSPFLIGPPAYPAVYLGRDTWAKPKTSDKYWPERKQLEPFRTDPTGLFIGRGRISSCIVVSHSCEIDDKPNVDRVLVAPIAAIETISNPASRAQILGEKRRAFLPLPGIPTMGDYYADLRAIASVDRRFIKDATRIASMSVDGLLRLQVQLIEYFSRISAPELRKLLEEKIAQQTPPAP